MARAAWREHAAAFLGGMLGGLLLLAFVLFFWYRSRGAEEATERVAMEMIEDEVEEDIAPPPSAEERPVGSILRFERAVGRALAGRSVPTSPLRGSVRVQFGDVLWRDPSGRPFLRAQRVAGVVDAGALQNGQVVASSATLVRPRVLLVRSSPAGPWNWQQMISNGDGNDGGGTDGLLRLLVRNTDIRQGHAEIRLPEGTWEFEAIDAELSRVLVPRGQQPPTTIDVTRLSTRVIRPDTTAPVALAVENATVRVVEGTFPFEAERVALDGATFQDAEGVWSPSLPGLGLAATARRGDVQFAEVRDLFPTLPEEGRAGFAVELEPLPSGATRFRFTGLDFFSGGSEAHGSVEGLLTDAGVSLERLDLRLEPLDLTLLQPYVDDLPFLGTLRGRVEGTPADLRYDVAASLRGGRLAEPVDARLVGTLSLADGFTLRGVQADLRDVPLAALRAFAPGLPVSGRVSGRISITGTPGEGPLALDVRLDLASGVANVEGTLDLGGPMLRYDLTGRLIDVRLAELTDARIPPVDFTGSFDLEGAGTEPRTATAVVSLAGRLSGWETVPGDSLRLRGRVAGGSVTLDTLAAEAGPAALSSAGEWTFVEPGGGALRYRLAVADLQPVAPYIPALPDTTAEGSLVMEGTITGTLDAPRVTGALASDELEVRTWLAEGLRAEYSLALGRPLPQLELEATAATVQTGAGTFRDARLSANLERPRFEVMLTAQRVGGGELEFATEGMLRPEEREAVVRSLHVDLREQHWVLERPTAIRWGGIEGVSVDSLVVRQQDGVGSVILAGRIPPTGASELDLMVEEFPVGEALRLAGFDTDVSGPLTARLEVRGSRGEPIIDGTFALTRGRFRDMELEEIGGTLRYRDRRLRIDAEAALAPPSGVLDMEVAIPLALSFDPLGAEVLDAEPLSGSVRTQAFPAAAFEGMIPNAEQLEGRIDADVRLSGTIADPRVQGSAQLRDGTATVVPLEQRFRNITAVASLEGDRLVVRSFEAQSGGWARGEGTVTLADGEPTVELELQLDDFRAIRFGEADPVQSSGRITLSGPLTEPVVRGRVRLQDGVIELPASRPVSAFEEELTRVQEREPVAVEAFAGVQPPPAFRGFRLDNVDVTIGDDVWFAAEDSRAQLRGNLTVSGSPDGVQIVGTLRGERGTFVLRAGPVIRRFDVIDAEVRFFGSSPPDPAIDITASRTVLVENGRVDVRVRIAGTVERPTISLATGGGETVAESQLLSFLLFGQPGVDLGAGTLPGEQVVGQAFFGGLGDIAAIELEEAIVSQWGAPFDVFHIRLGGASDFGFGAPTVVVGREVIDDVFLTVDAGVSALFGEGGTTGSLWSVTLEWQIDPEWSAELGIAPIERSRLLRGGRVHPLVTPRQELYAEIRRRWTY